MRGSLTLDFILSLVLIMASVASFFALAATQVENTAVVSTQLKAEAMAMGIGSAINHFAAIQPGNNSYMVIDLNQLPVSQGVDSFGMPGYSVFASDQQCVVSVHPSINQVSVDIELYRMDSGEPTNISAYYPIATTSNTRCEKGSCPLDPTVSVYCNESIKIKAFEFATHTELEVDPA